MAQVSEFAEIGWGTRTARAPPSPLRGREPASKTILMGHELIRNEREISHPVADLGRRRSPAIPLALLLLALATVFLFGGDRGYFYKPFIDDHITLHHMTMTENLAPEHHFLGFYRQILDADGNRSYVPYNRFPPLGHVLIRLVTLPFPDDISARVLAARLLRPPQY